MAAYSITQIEQDVRCLLDENKVTTSLAGFGDADTLELSAAIRSRILEAVAYVHQTAPYYLLDNSSSSTDTTITWEGNENYGSVSIPNDCLRVLAFKMSDWRRVVTTFHDMSTPLYALQRSVIPGVRGNFEKPVCFIGIKNNNTNISHVVEFYSCKSKDATVALYSYLKEPAIDASSGQEKVDISSKCYDAFLYHLCGLLLATFNDANRSSLFMEHSKHLLETSTP